MSQVNAAEEANYQAEVRQKLQRLRDSLHDRWCRWDDWERGFIVSITQQLDQPRIDITPKQYAKVWDLWERSLR